MSPFPFCLGGGGDLSFPGVNSIGVSGVRLQQAFSYNVDNVEFNPSLSPIVSQATSSLDSSSSGTDTISQPTEPSVSSEDYFSHQNQLPATGFASRNTAAARGVFKAIILGQVGQEPVQRILKSGRSITIFTIGTGGMRTDRRPYEADISDEVLEQRSMQWHRVCVHQERLGAIAYRVLKKGMQVYVEGNIETRVFNDSVSGAIRRVREVVLRQNGRLMFMQQPAPRS
ncbi:hypothetical protein O6H91_14G079300 [Diphasiastrum complanatum]|uniref:Uncharacterized protein n=2 Tax=Diphasiastrum complanatum TaxID=34168 RepID=A0ACC2BRD6_DIPCM|nr:hypothetical protein O6H91_14G079100 [Diphasiastrum complanatum]KAJ7532241.1 hypothetical protein O6H91_14G079300 [Diphasiastrum complanatum]